MQYNIRLLGKIVTNVMSEAKHERMVAALSCRQSRAIKVTPKVKTTKRQS